MASPTPASAPARPARAHSQPADSVRTGASVPVPTTVAPATEVAPAHEVLDAVPLTQTAKSASLKGVSSRALVPFATVALQKAGASDAPFADATLVEDTPAPSFAAVWATLTAKGTTGLMRHLARLGAQQRNQPRLTAAPLPPGDEAARDVFRNDYAAFLRRYFPHYATVDPAPMHVLAANAVRDNPTWKGLWMWFRGAAKSTHADVLLPLWLLIQKPTQLRFMLLVGKSEKAARRLLADLQHELTSNHLLRTDFGLAPMKGHWTKGEFATTCGASFVALGMGQSPRGLRRNSHRPDYIVADDLDHAQLSQNPRRVDRYTRWLIEDVLGTLDVGRGRFVFANNLFSRNSIMGRLADRGTFDCLRLDALDAEGLPTWPAKYGAEGLWLRERQQQMGYRAFAREYLNTPVDEGGVFQPHWVRWVPALPWQQYRTLVCYIDPSFRHGPQADYKAAKLWGLTSEGQYHHLRAFVRQAPPAELARWCHALAAEVAHTAPEATVQFVLEGGFIQDVFRDAFEKERPLGAPTLPLRIDNRKKPPKAYRIEGMAHLWEQGSIAYADTLRTDPDTQTGLDQLYAFQEGSRAHDDGPDADEGALWLLQQVARTTDAPTPIVGARITNRWYG